MNDERFIPLPRYLTSRSLLYTCPASAAPLRPLVISNQHLPETKAANHAENDVVAMPWLASPRECRR